jgi:hypothetical protein
LHRSSSHPARTKSSSTPPQNPSQAQSLHPTTFSFPLSTPPNQTNLPSLKQKPPSHIPHPTSNPKNPRIPFGYNQNHRRVQFSKKSFFFNNAKGEQPDPRKKHHLSIYQPIYENRAPYQPRTLTHASITPRLHYHIPTTQIPLPYPQKRELEKHLPLLTSIPLNQKASHAVGTLAYLGK